MKRHLFILIVALSASVQSIYAQYYSVNYDEKTVAAMASAFGMEATAEAYYNEQVSNILKHYNAAEVATAGIFASKFLEQKALSDLGIWNNSTENYYYRRIYNMVSEKIIPKIWIIAKMMLKSPHNAIYWGSYLVKICDETKALCMQFESVVTNSTLSFSDITFLEFKEEFATLLSPAKLGDVNWELLLNDITKVSGNFTKENLKADLDNLYQMGAGLATAGISNIGDRLFQTNSFNELFKGNISKISDIYNNYADLFALAEQGTGTALLQLLGGTDNVAQMFQLSNYNLTAWMDDYLNGVNGSFYTQRWYIARREKGSETLCNYYPPTDDESILNGGQWTRFETSDPSFYPNSSQTEQILRNSESYAGWSRERVKQLNAQDERYSYTMTYYRSGYIISKKNKQTKKAYAYEIHVTKSWDWEEVVYEDIYDSYYLDLNTFKGQLNARLSEFNDNEDGYTYYLASDARNYYQATDAAKIKGCESVTISVTCSDGALLAQGSTQYKCRSCGSSLNAHSKECAMTTSVTESNLDTSELDQMKSEAENNISLINSQITLLKNENNNLMKLISSASVEDAAVYRQQYNQNLTQIENLENELKTWESKLKEIQSAQEEAGNDNEVITDDYYRIPAIMQDCKTAFNLTWDGAGYWSGYTYIRKATMPNINGIITFKATLTLARKPKYFLGIKIHRAILQISWDLTTEYTDTHVADVIILDTSASEAEKTKIVNDRISEIAREHPSCKITTEYSYTEPLQENVNNDVVHLLWSSERLEIAREVDTRITRIYADLVSLEKMMYYKRDIIDVLKDIAPHINDDQGRRLSLVEECHQRWIETAKSNKKN